jgi:hypothetical protein
VIEGGDDQHGAGAMVNGPQSLNPTDSVHQPFARAKRTELLGDTCNCQHQHGPEEQQMLNTDVYPQLGASKGALAGRY